MFLLSVRVPYLGLERNAWRLLTLFASHNQLNSPLFPVGELEAVVLEIRNWSGMDRPRFVSGGVVVSQKGPMRRWCMCVKVHLSRAICH